MMVQNKGGAPNTAPMPEVQPPTVVVVLPGMPGAEPAAATEVTYTLASLSEAEE
jgi:hypothetical protein